MPYRFKEFELNTEQNELSQSGSLVRLEPQAMDLLILLIEEKHRVVSKEEINTRIWKSRVVSDAALSSRISMIRKVLGDDGRKQKIIRTVHKKGFRFVADVEGPGTTSTDYKPATGNNSAETPDLQTSDPFENSDSLPSIAVLPFKNLSEDPDQ